MATVVAICDTYRHEGEHIAVDRKLTRRIEELINANLGYQPQTECLVWRGKRDLSGRPVIRVGLERETVLVRDFIYQRLFETAVGAGVELKPRCGTVLCCQGDHLEACEVEVEDDEVVPGEPGDIPEITGFAPAICGDMPGDMLGDMIAKTECPQGHEFTPENTVVRKNGRGVETRACRLCIREVNKRSAERRKERGGDTADPGQPGLD